VTPVESSLAAEVQRRRTFAIISHPDAGKTTLTEKLLLYGGAIHLAGSVKARRAQRHATSDWMEMEKERGISVTSTVLQFEYHGYRVNLLDTPGHQDFSEDTYRTLVAADSAVMLLDNRKGVEEQTRKLFEVCRLRRTPVFTLVNKCDRPGADPLQLLDDVEAELGLACAPVTWPILERDRLVGVYDRLRAEVHVFHKGGDHGQTRVDEEVGGLHDPEVRGLIGGAAHDRLAEELELLSAAGADLDPDAVLAGTVSPTFFGSALTNFGIGSFLDTFMDMAPSPVPRDSSRGLVRPTDDGFSGFVFKIQANLDPRHRDRIAFIRVCSGRFEPGLTVTNVRSGKTLRLTQPQQVFARERAGLDEAWPGDVVGLHDRGSLHIGDTLSEDAGLEFGGIPRFSPEHFARVSVPDPLRRKHLDTGLAQLSEEGAAQVFYGDAVAGPAPIVGAVGPLQFDVLLHRLDSEYDVTVRLERLPYVAARWVEGTDEDIRRVASGYDRKLVRDSRDRPLILFESRWALERTVEKETALQYYSVAP